MIVVDNLSMEAGAFRLDEVSLHVPTGEYGVLMGPTGGGKTSIIEAIAGLRPIKSGSIRLGDVEVTRRKPAERDIGYVPQDGALFPTMNVRDHLAFALVIRRSLPSLIEERVAEMAKLLGIGHLLDRTIQKLSGGERQRVALGRALSFHPRTLLLDEPLSALDDDTRSQMCRLLKEVQHRTGVTTLHVTHSVEEAERLADCQFRINNGGIVRTPARAS
ncbi:MAG: ATP-binding cassette domain-containing protein [Planctomycetales bacterium]|nr:ATP-binding cassette domain-containing protein [Planctomycetales bacterium]MCA9228778.1 ATP-binding cassette domain-containing protein [Planctomycetales bacterium]